MESAVLQVHPSRRCNLRCLHCYSQSGPEHRGSLPMRLLATLLDDAAAEGYRTLSVSGGEPLMYGPLPELLGRARSAGLTTTVTTNGTLLRPRYLDPIAGSLDLLAISLDGRPASHDRLRASPTAFALLDAGLAEVRRRGLAFGFIFTLTQHNLHELGWVTAYARTAGAKLLQIHPLEMAGRAGDELPHSRADRLERAHAWVECLRMQAEVGHDMRIQLDLAGVGSIAADPRLADPQRWVSASAGRPLAELCSPLVLEPDGTLVPFTYGFPRRLRLGNIIDERLPVAAGRWRRDPAPFLAHCAAAYAAAVADGAALVNWFEYLGAGTAQLP